MGTANMNDKITVCVLLGKHSRCLCFSRSRVPNNDKKATECGFEYDLPGFETNICYAIYC